MKKKSINTMVALLGVAFFVACSGQKERVVGTIVGCETDTVYVMKMDLTGNSPMVTDLVALDNGKLLYTVDDSLSYRLNIVPKPTEGKALSMQGVDLFLFPGDKLNFSATFDNNGVDFEVRGNDFYKNLNSFKLDNKALIDQRTAAMAAYLATSQSDSIALQQANEAYTAANNIVKNAEIQYIRNNPASDLSGFFFTTILADSVDTIYPVLAESVINGKFSKGIVVRKQRSERETKMKVAQERIKPGLMAPDFTLKDLKGADFTLSSLFNKNKYIVLDFWGSWCGYCINGFPDMKKMYEKYEKKLDVVGIDCGDTIEKWTTSVEGNKLPWINVYNPSTNDMSIDYAVAGYPTKVVIAPDGKIVEVILGEDPAFYKLIDSLMK